MSDLDPKYKVITSDSKFEVREYSPMVLAQTKVRSKFKKATEEGFDILVKYISKDNEDKAKINMTSPVIQQSEKIQVSSEFVTDIKDYENYVISFIMPNNLTMDNLPQPLDHRIELKEIKGKKYACLKFRGKVKESLIVTKEKELLEMLGKHQLKAKSTIQLWRFDPPFNLGFFQKNIFAVEV